PCSAPGRCCASAATSPSRTCTTCFRGPGAGRCAACSSSCCWSSSAPWPGTAPCTRAPCVSRPPPRRESRSPGCTWRYRSASACWPFISCWWHGATSWSAARGSRARSTPRRRRASERAARDAARIMALTLFVILLVLFALGMPIAFALALATSLAVLIDGRYPQVVVLKQMFSGIDSFPLMAVPFFILAAELMSGGAITVVLLRFAAQFVSHLRGGLGYANILALTLFSGVSGSAMADVAGPGAMMSRMMEKAGYDRDYAAALTASTAIIGPVIPPSIIMIIYALQDESVSV